LFNVSIATNKILLARENHGLHFQVKLFLGAIGGELTAELPFVLMHPKPNMRKIIKADTLADVEGFNNSVDDPDYDPAADMNKLSVNKDKNV
jgi:hypothetical protein